MNRKYVIVSILVLVLIASFLVFRRLTPFAASNNASAATFAAIRATADARLITPTPTLPVILDWKTLNVFTSTGNMTTSTLSVPNQWRLTWSCLGFSSGINGSLGIIPRNTSGYVATIISSKCGSTTPTSGTFNEIGGGSLWLQFNAAGRWWQATVWVPDRIAP